MYKFTPPQFLKANPYKYLMLLGLVLVLLVNSCTKNDALIPQDATTFTNIDNRFFSKKPSTDPIVERIMTGMQGMKVSAEYWNNFGKTNGLPVWNKTLSLLSKNTQSNSFSNAGASRDTVFFIPLVLEGDSMVNGFIRARVRDSINLNFCLAEDFTMYGYKANNTESEVIHFTTTLIALNNLVFQYKDYTLNDTRLYSADTSSQKVNKIEIDTIQSNLLSTVCVTTTFTPYHCGTEGYSGCTDADGCDFQACANGFSCYPLLSVTTSSCSLIDDGVWPTTGTIGTNGSGGGGQTFTIPHYTPPCMVSLCPPPVRPGPITPIIFSYEDYNIIEVYSDPSLEKYFDISEDEPEVDLTAVFNCFNLIPNNGATYSIKLCADLPINGIPMAPINFNHKSPGHTFLTFTKTNGSQTISQSVGFYPTGSGGNPLDPTADGVFKDNGASPLEHEYNAALNLNNITLMQFETVMNFLKLHENDEYDLSSNNCTSMALKAINRILSPRIFVEPFVVQIPQIPTPMIYMQSPQKLYKWIQGFSPSSPLSNITKEFDVEINAPTSHLPCD